MQDLFDDFDIDQSILKEVKAAVGRVAKFENGDPAMSDDENPLPTYREESTEKENKSVTPSSSELLDQRIFELREEARLLEAEIQLLEQEDGTCNGGVAPLEGTAVCEGEMEEMVDEIVHSATGGKLDNRHVHDEYELPDKEALSVPAVAGEGEVLAPAAAAAGGGGGVGLVGELQSLVKLNQALSGIKMETVNWEVVEKKGPVLLREHFHSGTVEGYSFNVTFIAREDSGACAGASGAPGGRRRGRQDLFDCAHRIISMKPEVDDRIAKDAQTWLSRVSSECDLVGFYQLFCSYCLACRCRRETWRTLQSAIGQSLSLPGGLDGNRCCFYDYSSRARLNFMWDLPVPAYSVNIEEKVSLQTLTQPKVPSDQLERIAEAPPLLRDLVNRLGVRAGLLELFKSLVPEANWLDK